MVHQGPT